MVQVKDADGQVQPYHDPDPGVVWAGPLVVLTSKFSASASEILAGAIQDYHRGLIVGDHSTHGKGTVQSLMDLSASVVPAAQRPADGRLKITMQQFYRPSGDSTQKRGVLADVELPSLTSHLDVGESDLDYPVAFDHVDPLSFQHFGYVAPTLVGQLRQLSAQRLRRPRKNSARSPATSPATRNRRPRNTSRSTRPSSSRNARNWTWIRKKKTPWRS